MVFSTYCLFLYSDAKDDKNDLQISLLKSEDYCKATTMCIQYRINQEEP